MVRGVHYGAGGSITDHPCGLQQEVQEKVVCQCLSGTTLGSKQAAAAGPGPLLQDLVARGWLWGHCNNFNGQAGADKEPPQPWGWRNSKSHGPGASPRVAPGGGTDREQICSQCVIQLKTTSKSSITVVFCRWFLFLLNL